MDKDVNPLVTIGITCFNAKDTVGRAIASAVRQNWHRLEILVVDDASTDSSVEAIRQWCERDRRVRLVEHEVNAGTGAARQTLLDAATGDYVAFFDDDDVSDPRRIEAQIKCHAAARAKVGDRPVVCYAAGRRVYPNGYVKDLPAIGSRGDSVCGEALSAFILANRRARGCFYGAGTPACALFVARADALAVGGFDPALRRVQDLDFAVRIGLQGGCACGTTERLFTQYATEAADKSADIKYQAELKLVDKHKAYLKRLGVYRSARRWFGVRYYYFAGRWPAFFGSLIVAFLISPVQVARRVLGNAPARLLHDTRRKRSSRV